MIDKESEWFKRYLKAAKNEIDRQIIHKRVNSKNDHMVYLDGCLDLERLIIAIIEEEARPPLYDPVTKAYEESKEQFGELYKNLGET